MPGPWNITCSGLRYWIIRRTIDEFPGAETLKDRNGKTRRFKTGREARKVLEKYNKERR